MGENAILPVSAVWINRDDRPRLIVNSKQSWPAMDRFEAMRAFARVMETGSFTRAAAASTAAIGSSFIA